MLHPLLKVMIKKPDLIVTHIGNYLDLFRAESMDVAGNAVRRLVAWVAFAITLSLFLVFTGVALMLGLLQNQFHWSLVAVPAIPLLLAFIAWGMTRKPVLSAEVGEIKRQFMADIEAFHVAGEKDA